MANTLQSLGENPCIGVVYGTSGMANHRIIGIRDFGAGSYVLRMDRCNLDFEPGQYIIAGLPHGIHRREYSVYSSPSDDFLEILIKEIDGGHVSSELRRLSVGDKVNVEGAFGYFRISVDDLSAPFLFIATGTGISPFHSFTRFYPDLDYRLVHGIRSLEERYDYADYDKTRIFSCVSREEGGSYQGRVTGWLKENRLPEDSLVYLCGNSGMVDEVYSILASRGFSADRIHAELYF